MSCNRIGVQEPTKRIIPPLDNYDDLYSDGDNAIELAASFNLVADPWQCLVVNDWLKRDDNDRFVSMQCGLSVPRQNGKNEALLIRELYGLAVNGEKILHTAHRVDTARKSFMRLVMFFDNPEYPELQEMVVQIRKTNGQESITLTNGASIEFSSRVNGGARGSTYDVVVFDEAQELTNDQLESIMSTMAAAPLNNRQMFFTGTPPSPVSPGDVFRKIRTGAISGENKHICWLEWGVDSIGDVTDRNRWYQTNPALGIHLEEEFTEAELSSMDAGGFARERLGFWVDGKSANAVFSTGVWAGVTCEAKEVPPPRDDEKIAYGVKFSPDGTHYALGVAVKSKDAPVLFELIQYGLCVTSVTSIAKWLLERKDTCSMCAIDGRSNTATLAQKLIEGGFPRRALKILGTKDMCAAASMFTSAVNEQTVIHARAGALDDSAINATKRNIGNEGAWSFGDGQSACTPLESVAIAYWAVQTTKRHAGKRSKLL